MKKNYKVSYFYRLLTIILSSILISSNGISAVSEVYAAETVQTFQSETYMVTPLSSIVSRAYYASPLASVKSETYTPTQLATSSIQLEDYMFGSQLTGLSRIIYDTLLIKGKTVSTNPIAIDMSNTGYTTSNSYQISTAVQLAFNALMDDFPFYTWIYISDGTNVGTSYSYESSNGIITKLVITPVLSPYYSSVSDVNAAFKAENNALNALIQSMPSSANTRYKRIEYIHDYLVDNVTYDNDALNAYSYYSSTREATYGYAWMAYGALVKKSCVCEGYAKAFKLACDRLGIPCQIVIGSAGGPHMWNHVQMEDGKWYAVDTTFDDPVYYGTPDAAQLEAAKDLYFIVGTNVLNSTSPVHSYTGARGYSYSTLSSTSYDPSYQVTEPLVTYTTYLHERYNGGSTGETYVDTGSGYTDTSTNNGSSSGGTTGYDSSYYDDLIDQILKDLENDFDFDYDYDTDTNTDTDTDIDIDTGVTVPPTINYTSKTIYVDKKVTLKISNLAYDAEVTYISSDTEVAKVSSTGKVTGLSSGTAMIMTVVEQNGETYILTTTIKVKEPYIKFTKKVSKMSVGDSVLLKVKRYGFSSPVTFSVNKTSRASIVKQSALTARITAKKTGTVKVTASSGGMKVTFTIKIVP